MLVIKPCSMDDNALRRAGDCGSDHAPFNFCGRYLPLPLFLRALLPADGQYSNDTALHCMLERRMQLRQLPG